MSSELSTNQIEGPTAEAAIAFRVLVIVSRPLNADYLPELADSWAICYGLSQVEARVYIRLLKPPTFEELANALAEDWDVIHFGGHAEDGANGTSLVFEDETGLAVRISSDRLAELLSKRPPRLLILSACGSAVGEAFGLAGDLNRAGIPICIGTVESVTTAWTQRFLRPLYAALGAGRSIREAFDHAVLAIKGEIDAGECQAPVIVGEVEEQSVILCAIRLPGKPIIIAPQLVNWIKAWQGEFQGEYIDRDDSGEPITPPMGRKGYALRLTRALTDGARLIVIIGLGGIGKSAMTAFTARRIAWKFPGGVFWIDGRDYLDRQIPLEALLNQFSSPSIFGPEFSQLPPQQKLQRVRSYLEMPNKGCLFVVDNAEGISPALLRFITELPEPSAALLTTRDEPEYGGVVISLPAMTEDESLSLLIAAIEQRSNESPEMEWVINEEGVEGLIEIINLLDNHPLALLHAAALVVSEGLERTLRLVREHPAQGRETHERFDFSYVTLTGGQRDLLHRLASFSSSFDEQAIEAICTNEGFTTDLLPDWDSELRTLRNRSFIEQYNLDDLEAGYRRFRLHPVMRDYVRTKIRQTTPRLPDFSGERHLKDQDHNIAQYYRSLMHFLASNLNNLETAGSAVVAAHIERNNLLAAQKTCLEQEQVGEVMEFCHLLDQLFRRSGDWTERKQAIEAGLKMAEASGNKVEIGARLHNLAIVAMDMGELKDAQELCLRSVEFSKQIEPPQGTRAVAQSIHLLGTIAFTAKRPEIARHNWGQSLDLAEEAGDQEIVGLSHLGLGMVETVNNHREEAHAHLERALVILRGLDKKDQVAGVLHQFGVLAHHMSNYPDARAALSECFEMNEALTDMEGTAKALAMLALVYEKESLFDDALARTEAAERIFIRLGNQAHLKQVREQLRRIKAIVDEAAGDV
jgi:tetratricopeptide (TPR) repeat protein